MAWEVFAAGILTGLAPLMVMIGMVMLVVGIVRIRVRWLAAAAALWLIATLVLLLADDEPWQIIEVVSVRVRAIDATTGRAVTPDSARIEGADGEPHSVSTVHRNAVVVVSAVVAAEGTGSISRWLRGNAAATVNAYQLVVEAEGYRISKTPLAQLLPRDWPLNSPEGIVEIGLERATGRADFGS